jgi:acetyl esterase/lipase
MFNKHWEPMLDWVVQLPVNPPVLPMLAKRVGALLGTSGPNCYWSWEHPGNPLVIDTKSVLSAYLGGNPSEVPSNYTAASPTRLVTSSSPPTLLLHGGRDELVSVYQSDRLAQRLREAGVRHFNLALPWATHGFDYILRGPGSQISTYAIEYFLSCVT